MRPPRKILKKQKYAAAGKSDLPPPKKRVGGVYPGKFQGGVKCAPALENPAPEPPAPRPPRIAAQGPRDRPRSAAAADRNRDRAHAAQDRRC